MKIEGLEPEEILEIPDEVIDGLVFCGEPVTFRAGSAELLGEFTIEGTTMVVELAQIDGGGEGVLPAIWTLAKRLAQRRGLTAVDWRVYATNCAKPNPKLRPLLERRGFTVQEVRRGQVCYRLVVDI